MVSAVGTSSLFDNPQFLSQSLKQKDRAAFEYMHDRYCSGLYSLIFGIVNNPFTADAVLEKVFALAWKGINEFDPSKGSLFIWMTSLARQESLSAKAASIAAETQDLELPSSFRHIEGLKVLINQMPDPCKSVLLLSYFDNLGDQQIAAILGEDTDSVKRSKKRGLTILHKMIANAG